VWPRRWVDRWAKYSSGPKLDSLVSSSSTSSYATTACLTAVCANRRNRVRTRISAMLPCSAATVHAHGVLHEERRWYTLEVHLRHSSRSSGALPRTSSTVEGAAASSPSASTMPSPGAPAVARAVVPCRGVVLQVRKTGLPA